MTAFTLEEFKQLVAASYDGAEAEALDEACLETEFDDLGYDSLTVYEIITRIQDDYSVRITDDEIDELRTPAALIAHVSGLLVTAAG
jgi:act minimal PKS acyl carrier protein